MRRPQGVAIVTGPLGVRETDTFTCHHCQAIVEVPPKADPAALGGWCSVCTHLICPRCVGRGCTPWERTMERMEARDRFLRAVGL